MSAPGIAFILTLALAAFAARAQDPNFEHPHAIVSAARDGYSISGLVAHRAAATAIRHGIAMFPGHPGILRLREEQGRPKFELAGNFLVRSRRHWLDGETLLLVVDAPSDQFAAFSQRFRESPRYGEDVAALVREVSSRYGVKDWTFVGTSEGSVSAFHAARMNPSLVTRLVLTASVLLPGSSGPGLSGVDWTSIRIPALWAHHEADPCPFTAYRDARRVAGASGWPLITVQGGGPARGNACEAFTAHGFVGVERETIDAIRAWIREGRLPAEPVAPRKP